MRSHDGYVLDLTFLMPSLERHFRPALSSLFLSLRYYKYKFSFVNPMSALLKRMRHIKYGKVWIHVIWHVHLA